MMDKQTLLEQKRICDLRLAKERAALTEAKADARLNGRYMQPKQYAQLELQIKALAQRSQSLQSQISALNRMRICNINDCFREAAAKTLPEKTFLVVMELAHDIKRAKEAGIEK